MVSQKSSAAPTPMRAPELTWWFNVIAGSPPTAGQDKLLRKQLGEDWKERFKLGLPRATSKFTQRKLIKRGLRGVYHR